MSRCPIHPGLTSPTEAARGAAAEHGSSGRIEVARSSGGLVRRYLLASLGIFFVGVGWVGTFVPGLPTVGFLLLASYCFTRSCPWLEQRLIRNRFFARFLHYIDGDCEMPLRARFAAIGMMWASIGTSVFVLCRFRGGPFWLAGLIVGLGIVGTFCIWQFRRKPASAQ